MIRPTKPQPSLLESTRYGVLIHRSRVRELCWRRVMKVSYRGYEIEVYREESLGGWENLYWSIFRESDGYEADSGFSTGSDTVRDFVGYMKERVDAELADDNPWGEN